MHLNERELAGHGLVLGGPGSGKTTFLQFLVEASAGRMPVVVVDPKGSPALEATVRAHGGQVWTLDGKLPADLLGATQWSSLRYRCWLLFGACGPVSSPRRPGPEESRCSGLPELHYLDPLKAVLLEDLVPRCGHHRLTLLYLAAGLQGPENLPRGHSVAILLAKLEEARAANEVVAKRLVNFMEGNQQAMRWW